MSNYDEFSEKLKNAKLKQNNEKNLKKQRDEVIVDILEQFLQLADEIINNEEIYNQFIFLIEDIIEQYEVEDL